MHCTKSGLFLLGVNALLSAAWGESADTAAASDALQEIIVTAQRRTEDVQHAALSIDVVSPAAMGVAGVTRASDLQNLVPALQVSESGNSQQTLYIRSVGTFVAQSYTDPAVAFNLDGVALARPSSMTGVMYDMNRAEVLKGPQGTLYGRNATGGAINIIPNQPKIGETSGEVALTVGNYGMVHPEAAVNLGINDNSAARAAFTYTRHNGYQTDGTGDKDEYAGRAQYLFKTDDLSVRVSADYAHDGGHNIGGTLMGVQNPFTGAVTPSPFGRDVGPQDPRFTAILQGQYSFINGRFLEGIQGGPRTDDRFWGVHTQIDWTTPIGTLTVLPAYRESRLDDLSTGLGFASSADERDGQSSLEVRFASDNTGMLRWLAGGYFFHEVIDAVYQFNQEALSPIQTLNTGTLSKAVFARLTFAPIDNFRVSTGVRYTDDRKTFDGQSQILINACTAPPVPIPACPTTPLIPPAKSFQSLENQLALFPIIPGALYGSALPGAAASVFPLTNIPINQAQSYSKITWHAGVEYDVTPNSLLYASFDTGYHAGGFAFAEIKPTYAPEQLTAYSIGSKNRFFNDTLELNLEAFYWRYTDEQISHGGTDTSGAYVFYTDNAGTTLIKGLETSVKWLLPTKTLVTADVQYLGAAYSHFTYQTPAGGTNAPPLTSCPFAQTDATHYTTNCAGKSALQSPRWAGNIALQQTIPVGNYSLVGEIGAHAQTDSIVGFEMLPVEVQRTYAEGNGSLSFAPTHGNWSVMTFVNNLTNRRPYGVAYYNSVMSVIGAGVGAPRTEGVRVDYKF